MYLMSLILLLCLLVIHETLVTSSSDEQDTGCQWEARVLQDVLLGKQEALGRPAYRRVRPVRNSSAPIHVTFRAAMGQLLDVSEERQVVDIMVWEHMDWHDEFMTWRPEQYGNQTNIFVEPDDTWVPDVAGFSMHMVRNVVHSVMWLNHDGLIFVENQKHYTFPCVLNLRLFPFDRHKCKFAFGSWSYDNSRLAIQSEQSVPFSVPEFIPNPTWSVMTSWYVISQHFNCCEHPFDLYMFELTITRQYYFTTFVLVFPGLLLSALTLVVFCMPAHCPEKISVGLSIFLSFFVLLLVLVDSTPKQGSVPLLGEALAVTLSLVALSVLCTTFTFTLSARPETSRVPNGARLFVHYLGPLLFVTTPSGRLTPSSSKNSLQNALATNSPLTHPAPSADRDARCSPSRGCDSERRARGVYSWTDVATCIDRLLFVVFIIVNVTTILVISITVWIER